MLERGELPTVRIGRSIRVPVAAVYAWVDRNAEQAHNQPCAEPLAWKGVDPCHINAKTVPFGGCHTPTQAARELDALLAPQITEKRMRLNRSGN